MNSAEALDFVKRLKDDVINAKNPAAASRYFAADFSTFNPIPGRAPGLPGLQAALKEFFQAFPDIRETVEDVVAEANKIALASTIRATHRGAFLGVPASGKPVVFNISELYHMRAGKVAKAWVFFDAMALMGQAAAGGPPDTSRR